MHKKKLVGFSSPVKRRNAIRLANTLAGDTGTLILAGGGAASICADTLQEVLTSKECQKVNVVVNDTCSNAIGFSPVIHV
jgi:hypothetical protein